VREVKWKKRGKKKRRANGYISGAASHANGVGEIDVYGGRKEEENVGD